MKIVRNSSELSKCSSYMQKVRLDSCKIFKIFFVNDTEKPLYPLRILYINFFLKRLKSKFIKNILKRFHTF